VNEKIIEEVNKRLEESPSIELGGFSAGFKSFDLVSGEPAHIHMLKSETQSAKFWLGPPTRLAKNNGLDNTNLNKALKLVKNNHQRLFTFWREQHARAQLQNPIE
jgi:hypothetical protein